MTLPPDSPLARILAALSDRPAHVRQLQRRSGLSLHPRRLVDHLHTLRVYGLADGSGEYWQRVAS